MTNPTAQSGFTLLEVMIALVIFSIGLLGLSGLQAISLQNNQVAYSRTVATMLAYDMADRIRNNRTGTYSTAAIPAAAPTSCVTSSCLPAAMAAHDLWEWEQSLNAAQSNLLSAQGFITPAAGPTFTITIGWDEERKGNAVACPAAANSGIACVSIAVTP